MYKLDKIIESTSKEIEIVPFGDLHYGSENCRIDKFKNLISWATGKPDVYLIGMGDLIDCILPKDDRYQPNESKPYKDIDTLAKEIQDIITPVSNKILCMLMGNHEYHLMQDGYGDPVKKICQNLDISYGGFSAYIRLRLKPQTRKKSLLMWTHHGWFAGRKRGGKVNALEENMASYDADVYLAGHCFSDDTQILTNAGWRNIGEIKNGNQVITFNKDKEILELDNVNSVFEYDSPETLVNIKSENIDFYVTNKHRLLIKHHSQRPGKHYKHPWIFKKAVDFLSKKSFQVSLPSASTFNHKDIPIDDNWIRLCAWLISEGHFRKSKKSKSGISLYQNTDKAHLIRDTLTKCGLEFSEYLGKIIGREFTIRGRTYKSKKNIITFYIKEKSAKRVREIIKEKQIPQMFFNMSNRQFDIFLETLIAGDGNKRNENNSVYYSRDKKLIEDLQFMCFTHNRRTLIREKYNNYSLEICNRNTVQITQNNISVVNSKFKKVWCINTNNGTVVARRNGRILITGNSHDLWSTRRSRTYWSGARDVIFGNTGSFLETATLGMISYSERANYPVQKLGVLKIKWLPFEEKIYVSE